MNFQSVIQEHAVPIDPAIKEMLKTIRSLTNHPVILGGSIARGTHLSNYDCDIFVMFPKDALNISDQLEKILTPLQPERVHGSRDYFHIHINNILFEIIPVLKITNANEAKNVTDASPLHVEWIKKNIKGKEDDVKLLKLFLKSKNLYGAESYIQGFSGYVCEILTIHYGGFLPLLKAASKWKETQIIDTEKYYKSSQEVLFSLNKSKQVSPLIVIDPVQKERNAAAALNGENYQKLIEVSKKKLTEQDFKVKLFSQKALTEKAGKNSLLFFEIIPLHGKEDVMGAKMIKVFDYLSQQLLYFGFSINEKEWQWEGQAYFYFIVSPRKQKETEQRQGPRKEDEPNNIQAFLKKYPQATLKKSRYSAEVKRIYRTPQQVIENSIGSVYVKERVKSIRLIPC